MAAMQKHEGYFIGSRSWRNNNPGNLRWSRFMVKQVSGFASFASFADGWLALWYDLNGKCTGKTITNLKPTSTLADLIYVWAPAKDGNNPEGYIAHVCALTGFSRDTALHWFVAD